MGSWPMPRKEPGSIATPRPEVLASGRFAEEVRAAERFWQARGITAVPAVIFNERYLISGGQPAEVFENAIRKIAAESSAPAALEHSVS